MIDALGAIVFDPLGEDFRLVLEDRKDHHEGTFARHRGPQTF